MPEITLAGCAPTPLLHYLKALGVLRLVGEQADREARGRWAADAFALQSRGDEEGLVDFFLREYVPTPIVAPWNGGSGFYPKSKSPSARKQVEAIRTSTDRRLNPYKQAIGVATQVLQELSLDEPTEDRETKARILTLCRARLSDDALRWLDAAAVLGEKEPAFAPLLGTGGNDGRLEFANNFMQHVRWALVKSNRVEEALRAALFGVPLPSVEHASPGQFLPAGAEWERQGIRVNPWDFVLGMEGALMFAASVARRMGPDAVARRLGELGRRLAVFPFAVDGLPAGHATAGPVDAKDRRGEVWLPLWESSATVGELAHLFAEGRVQWQRKQAATAVDFARAVVSLGVDRGIREFHRYGFLKRSGRAYVAAPLGTIRVTRRPEADLLARLDSWVERVRAAAASRYPPERLGRALRLLDEGILAFCARGGTDRLQAVLLAAGAVEDALGRSPQGRGRALPAFGLDPGWVEACDDGSEEYELAAAIASLGPAEGGRPGPIREQIEPVRYDGNLKRFRFDDQSRSAVWSGRDLYRDLVRVLERRLIEAEQAGVAPPWRSRVSASPGAVAALAEGRIDPERMAALVRSFALIDWQGGARRLRPRKRSASAPGVEYLVVKVLFSEMLQATHGGDAAFGTTPDVKAQRQVLALLRVGDVGRALDVAARRLRAAGAVRRRWRGFGGAAELRVHPSRGLRLAAAMLVPVAGAEVAHRLREVGAWPGAEQAVGEDVGVA